MMDEKFMIVCSKWNPNVGKITNHAIMNFATQDDACDFAENNLRTIFYFITGYVIA